MSILHKLKYRFSEPYRIRIGCGLSPIRNEREYKALIKFCERKLADVVSMKLNPNRKKVYETTIWLHNNDSTPRGIWFKLPYTHKMFYNTVYDFVDDHVGYYWD